jgi:uncharacterized protein
MGRNDLQTPPEDNPPLFAQALRRGGNTHYTFRSFAGADHAAHVSPDGGVTRGPALAPGYAELVGSWIRDVTSGHLPNADAQTPPKQDYPSTDAPPSARWESGRIQLAAFVLFVVAFIAYPLVALVRRLRGRTVQPVSRWASPTRRSRIRVYGLAVAAAAIATAVAWRRAAASLPQGERVPLGLLLTAGTAFLPWAFYWGLLLP